MRRVFRLSTLLFGLGCGALGAPATAPARDFALYPIGETQQFGDVTVALSFLQPLALNAGMMRAADRSDIHLEADIAAAQDDPNGYAKGEWRPYAVVHYTLTRLRPAATEAPLTGTLIPLIGYNSGGGGGKDHYGDNIEMRGPGRYRLALSIHLPEGRDIALSRDFVFAGAGKKGAY